MMALIAVVAVVLFCVFGRYPFQSKVVEVRELPDTVDMDPNDVPVAETSSMGTIWVPRMKLEPAYDSSVNPVYYPPIPFGIEQLSKQDQREYDAYVVSEVARQDAMKHFAPDN